MNEENKNELSISEPEWQARFRGEYKALKERYNKLHRMIVKYDAGTLDFKPTCSIDLLRRQKATMGEYLNILEIRAEIENIRGLDDDTPKLKSYIVETGACGQLRGRKVNRKWLGDMRKGLMKFKLCNIAVLILWK